MTHYTLTGIDPGLVHNGVVALHIDTDKRTLAVRHTIVDGQLTTDLEPWPEATAQEVWVEWSALLREFGMTDWLGYTFIEQYRDRGTAFVQHGPMRRLETLLKQRMPEAKLVDNTGVKRVIKPGLMKLLGLWNFPTTNHRDLQAAARIMLYGAVKNDQLNRVLYQVVTEIKDGTTWERL